MKWKVFCCSIEGILLKDNEVPLDFYLLYTSSMEEAKDLRKYIRTYNKTFAFTSFKVHYDKNLSQKSRYINISYTGISISLY